MESIESNSNRAKYKQVYYLGLAANALSFGLFQYFRYKYGSSGGNWVDDGFYFINFGLAIAYALAGLVSGSLSKKNHSSIRVLIQVILLFSTSCFSVNLGIPIFARFTPWASAYLMLMHLALLAFCFDGRLPASLRTLNFGLMGAGIVMTLYFVVYLMPFMGIGLIAIIFFGLGLLVYVPLMLLIAYIRLYQKLPKRKADKWAFSIGIGLPVLFGIAFLFTWAGADRAVKKAEATLITRPNNTLPTWAVLSQSLPYSPMAERIIKGKLLYQTFHWDWNLPTNSFSEQKTHDPLINLGMAIMGELDLNDDDRIKIVKSHFDARHAAQRKLWSGADLSTDNVLTNIKVYPEYRMAYTEKIISIKNNATRSWSDEEAAYTFYMPQGAVATSLSLWINGKEEPSRLTTKKKADSAYVQIVGRERRDPALLHWQEGNTVTVTVFPCPVNQIRRFKLGATVPMQLQGNRLVLPNMYFEGPELKGASETAVIQFATPPVQLKAPGFSQQPNGMYLAQGSYRPYWELSCQAPALASGGFSFNGKCYQVSRPQWTDQALDASAIYLDLNKSWSRNQFHEIMSLLQGKSVYVFYDELIALTESNKELLWETLSAQHFSLFPVHMIPNFSNSLLISKSTRLSPCLADLQGSPFAEQLKHRLANEHHKLQLFELGDQSSPYLRTLGDYQVFHQTKGSMQELKSHLVAGTFPVLKLNAAQVYLPQPQMIISEDTTTTQANGAPNHLMRLYAYNRIMKDMGASIFANEHITQQLIGLANEAFVVSPVSSLVVLETQKDYQRFGIHENKNSLKNASAQQDGAIPEPHEWTMIILLAAFFGWLFWRKKQLVSR